MCPDSQAFGENRPDFFVILRGGGVIIFFFKFSSDLSLQADLRTKEDGEECEEFLAAEEQV